MPVHAAPCTSADTAWINWTRCGTGRGRWKRGSGKRGRWMYKLVGPGSCTWVGEVIRKRLLNSSSKEKCNMLNDKRIKACISRYDNGAYSRMQFLAAVSHSIQLVLKQCIVTNCRQQQQQRRGWNEYEASPATTSESSDESPATAAAMLLFALKGKYKNNLTNKVRPLPVVYPLLNFAVWTNCQFQCKVLVFGGR